MVRAKIAVNGYGTIGKRVADAVRAQKIWKLSEFPRQSLTMKLQ